MDLNFVIKSLGKRGNEAQRWSERENRFWKNVLDTYTELLSKTSQTRIMFRPYGSAAEDLNCQTPDDVGDLDVVIFPDSDQLRVHDEMIEYLPDYPMHVRIKGAHHPVLQSCLVKDTKYVATSALKNFHPAIYGNLGNLFHITLQIMSQRDFSSVFSCHLKNRTSTSPALTLDFALSPKEVKPTSFQSTKGELPEAFNQLPEKTNITQSTEMHEDADDKSEIEETAEQNKNFFVRSAETIDKDLPNNQKSNNADEKTENEGTCKQTKRMKTMTLILEQMFGSRTETKENLSKETKVKDKNTKKARYQTIEGGIDYVPALKVRGWPKVAQEWITRGRKWPSPDIVNRVLQDGYHLVVKPPKIGGNPECDFRISFGHAEYLLSQQMNNIHRECYRCLKKFHRAYLSTEPKSLVTFHLKNILFQTIEETGAETWTESNRGDCTMKLLRNLLEALKKKDLRHYFVRSYNLFCVDYVKSPNILESLAGKVEQVMENPMRFAKKLIQTMKEDLTTGEEHEYGQVETPTSKSTNSTQRKQMEASYQTSIPISYQYHELKVIFRGIVKELIDMVFNDAGNGRTIENVDPLERSLVEDLKEIKRNGNIQVEEFAELFHLSWEMVFMKVLFGTDPSMRHRMLDGMKGIVEMWKYMLKQGNFAPEDEEALDLFQRMVDPASTNAFDINQLFPTGMLTRLFQSELKTFRREPRKTDTVDIPLD